MVTNAPTPDVYLAACPCRHVLDRIADKWTALIVGALEDGTLRFGQLRRRLQGISQKVLTQTLRSLERDGLVSRRVHASVPPCVEYELTALGRTLREPLAAVRAWSEAHADAVHTAQRAYDTTQPDVRPPRRD